MAAVDTFEAVVRDKPGSTGWNVMHTGSPRDCRTKMVAEAGFMARGDWEVVGLNRMSITVRNDEGRETEFRVRKVVEDG